MKLSETITKSARPTALCVPESLASIHNILLVGATLSEKYTRLSAPDTNYLDNSIQLLAEETDQTVSENFELSLMNLNDQGPYPSEDFLGSVLIN